MGKLINSNKEEFNSILESEEGVVIVDFWAEWCGPCRVIGPVLQTISEEQDVTVVKVNVDDNSELGAEYGIRSIPTILVFKDGEQVEKLVGAQSQKTFEDLIDKHSGDTNKEETESDESKD